MRYGRKRAIKLQLRRRDYDEMVKKPNDYKGYKKPGSLSK